MSKKIKYLTLAGSLVIASGVGAQVYLCQQCSPGTHIPVGGKSCLSCPAGTYSNVSGSTSCSKCESGYYSKGGATSCTLCGANKRSTGSDCVDCGYWEYSNAGSTSCTGLKYEIESVVKHLPIPTSSNVASSVVSGTLTPGFYLIVLQGGNGGDKEVNYLKNAVLYGKGATLKYMIKVTSNTSYTIANGAEGFSSEWEDDDGDTRYRYNYNATGGGGGSWVQIGSTYYIAGGGGGASYSHEYINTFDNIFSEYKVSAVGGSGGSVGAGGSGGNQNYGDSDWGNYLGLNGGNSGRYCGYCAGGNYCQTTTCSGKVSGPSGGYKGPSSSDSCPTFQSSPYGGTGSAISKIPCPGFNRMFCYFFDNSEDNYGVTLTPISNANQCRERLNQYVIYFKDAENGKASHSDNTGGRFDNQLKTYSTTYWGGIGAAIFKIK